MKIRHRAGALAAVALLAVAGCGGSSSSGSNGTGTGSKSKPDTSPIKLGAIYTQGSGIDYSDAVNGTRAYFDQLNAAGGVNGRKIEFSVVNDGGDPSRAAAAARKLISDGVVGMVGGDSIVDCAVNGNLYAAKKVVNLVAFGSNPKCFSEPANIAVQNGALAGALATAEVAVKNLKAKRVQYITFDAPSGHDSAGGMEAYLKSKNALAGPSQFVAPGQDATPAVVRAKANKPDAICILATPDVTIAILKALSAQGIPPSKLSVLSVGTVYDPRVPKALGPAGEGLYVATDWYPLEGPKLPKTLASFQKEMGARYPNSGVNLLSQSGWLAGDLAREALSSASGNVTPASFGDAVRRISGYDNGMSSAPITVGPKPPYILNHHDFVVQDKGGKWVYLEKFGTTTWPPEGFKLPGS